MKPENRKAAKVFNMIQTFSNLELLAAYHYGCFHEVMEKVRLTYPCEDSERWEYDDETQTVRRVSLPNMEWLPFEEANEPF